MEHVGYKLIDAQGAEIQTWGGDGAIPPVPSVLYLPNGDHVHCPTVGGTYGGYTLTTWMREPLPAPVPSVVSARQARLALLQGGILAATEAMIAQQDEATRITWEYATEFRRGDPLLAALAANLNLTDAQIDQFFKDAAAL